MAGWGGFLSSRRQELLGSADTTGGQVCSKQLAMAAHEEKRRSVDGEVA